MRYAIGVFVAGLLMSIFAASTQARSRFDVSIGFNIGSSRCWSDYERVSVRYSHDDYRPRYRERVYHAPRVYCPPPPVIVYDPPVVYCPPPVIYSAPVVVYPAPCASGPVIIYNSSCAPSNYYYHRTTYYYGR